MSWWFACIVAGGELYLSLVLVCCQSIFAGEPVRFSSVCWWILTSICFLWCEASPEPQLHTWLYHHTFFDKHTSPLDEKASVCQVIRNAKWMWHFCQECSLPFISLMKLARIFWQIYASNKLLPSLIEDLIFIVLVLDFSLLPTQTVRMHAKYC